jgi:hypothetical protein
MFLLFLSLKLVTHAFLILNGEHMLNYMKYGNWLRTD